jgi:hypothetical protein
MTTINPKLTAALATIAILAPAAGAQAHGAWSPIRTARHYATDRPERHYSPARAKRPASRFQADHSAW